MKTVRVILSPEAEEVYEYLKSSKYERSLLTAVHTRVERIKTNIHYGNPIAKSKIPDEYKKKYGVKNLFRVTLSQYWRMLYTLTNDESGAEIIVFVLDIIDHKKYDKKFKYKGK